MRPCAALREQIVELLCEVCSQWAAKAHLGLELEDLLRQKFLKRLPYKVNWKLLEFEQMPLGFTTGYAYETVFIYGKK